FVGSTPFAERSISSSGRGVNGQQNIRVFRLDPAVVGAGIEASLSKFDAVWTSSMSWQHTDRPVGTPIDVFQTGQTGTNAIRTDDATFTTGLIKPLPTGGVAGIT